MVGSNLGRAGFFLFDVPASLSRQSFEDAHINVNYLFKQLLCK